MFILLVSSKWSSKSDSYVSETSISSLISGFFSSGGAGAVPSGGDHKSFVEQPSASVPAGCEAVIRKLDLAQSESAFAGS